MISMLFAKFIHKAQQLEPRLNQKSVCGLPVRPSVCLSVSSVLFASVSSSLSLSPSRCREPPPAGAPSNSDLVSDITDRSQTPTPSHFREPHHSLAAILFHFYCAKPVRWPTGRAALFFDDHPIGPPVAATANMARCWRHDTIS